MAVNKKISEFIDLLIPEMDGTEYLGGYAGNEEKVNIRVRLADLLSNTATVVKNSTYVQQVSYVDAVTGNDDTGAVNDATLPFFTIKAAVDSLTAAICSVRIGNGVYNCPEEVLQDISPNVQSLTMESRATTINASGNFVKANQTTLYTFSFLGGDTDIVSGNFGFAIEGSNIYNLKLVAKNIHGETTGLVLIHPGFNDIVVNGSISGGTGSGYGMTIRGSMITNIFVRENITSSGSSNVSNVISIRDVFGLLNLTWGGVVDASNLHPSASAIYAVNTNLRATINLKGNIVDTRDNSTAPAISLIQTYSNLYFTGNVDIVRGYVFSTTGNNINNAVVKLSGTFKTAEGGIIYKTGNRPLDLYLTSYDSEYKANAFYIGGRINFFLNGRIRNVSASSPLFNYPATIPTDAKVYVDDLEFTAFDEDTPIGTEGAFVNQLDVVVNGALRTNSTAVIPAHVNLTWLKDITLPEVTPNLSQVLTKGNVTSGTDIIASDGSKIDFSVDESIFRKMLLFPFGGYLQHYAEGAVEFKALFYWFRDLDGQISASLSQGTLNLGGDNNSGVIKLHSRHSNKEYTLHANNITEHREEIKPDGNIDWTALEEQDGFAMIWEDESKIWKPKPIYEQMILSSPNGSRWKLEITDGGELIPTKL